MNRIAGVSNWLLFIQCVRCLGSVERKFIEFQFDLNGDLIHAKVNLKLCTDLRSVKNEIGDNETK